MGVSHGRINGKLNVARAFGDFGLKANNNECLSNQLDQPVIAKPDVTVIKRNHKQDEFIFLACDGVFDALTTRQVVDLITDRARVHQSMERISSEVIQTCLAKDSKDNITRILVE